MNYSRGVQHNGLRTKVGLKRCIPLLTVLLEGLGIWGQGCHWNPGCRAPLGKMCWQQGANNAALWCHLTHGHCCSSHQSRFGPKGARSSLWGTASKWHPCVRGMDAYSFRKIYTMHIHVCMCTHTRIYTPAFVHFIISIFLLNRTKSLRGSRRTRCQDGKTSVLKIASNKCKNTANLIYK